MKTLEAISNFISKYMAAFVIIVAAIALFMPWTFTWSAKYVTYLLGIVMFGMGMTLRFEDFKLVFKRPKDVFIGALAQFTIMPALAWVFSNIISITTRTCSRCNFSRYLPRRNIFKCYDLLGTWRCSIIRIYTMTTTILSANCYTYSQFGGSLVRGLTFLYKQ